MEIGWKSIMLGFVLSLIIPIVLTMFLFGSLPPSVFFPIFLIDIMLFAIGGALFIGIMIFSWHRGETSFPVKVVIYEQRSGVVQPKESRAKRLEITADGKYSFQLKHSKETIQAVDYKYIMVTPQGKLFLNLYKPNAKEYHPITMTEAEGLKPIPENMRYFTAEQIRRNYERHYKKFGVEKYMPIMMLVVLGVIIAMVAYISFMKVGDVMSTAASISGGQAQMTEKLNLMIDKISILLGKAVNATSLPSGVPPPPIP